MFSTPTNSISDGPVETLESVHIACGSESPMNTGVFETYTQSTGTTTTTTLSYL